MTYLPCDEGYEGVRGGVEGGGGKKNAADGSTITIARGLSASGYARRVASVDARAIMKYLRGGEKRRRG